MKKALVLYWSATGNTEKVAKAITRGLTHSGYEVTEKKISEAETESYFAYDLVCFGTPSINWHPPKGCLHLSFKLQISKPGLNTQSGLLSNRYILPKNVQSI